VWGVLSRTPRYFTAHVDESEIVHLKWEKPNIYHQEIVLGYLVYRDGEPISDIITDLTFEDSISGHRYHVTAVFTTLSESRPSNMVIFGSSPGLNFSLIADDTQYEVSRGSAMESIIFIAALHNGLPVTQIASNGFANSQYLTHIYLPNTIDVINDGAFRNNTSLESITIPNSVERIGSFAFLGCTGLTEVLLEYDSSLTSIGVQAFESCTSLVNITIPRNVTSIGQAAFYGCRSLNTIHIPISVSYIGRNTFRYCHNLTIHAEASSRPAGWDINWNPDNRPVIWGGVSEDDQVVEMPSKTILLSNFPNPFNPTTSIRYQVSGIEPKHVKMNVYNVRGQRVRSLFNEYREPGYHSVVWDGRDESGMQVSSGVYFYRMIAGEYTETRRMVLMK